MTSLFITEGACASFPSCFSQTKKRRETRFQPLDWLKWEDSSATQNLLLSSLFLFLFSFSLFRDALRFHLLLIVVCLVEFSGRFDAVWSQTHFLTFLELAILAQFFSSFDCKITLLFCRTIVASVNVLTNRLYIKDSTGSANNMSCWMTQIGVIGSIWSLTNSTSTWIHVRSTSSGHLSTTMVANRVKEQQECLLSLYSDTDKMIHL